jgi:hypothetical protein
MVFKRPTARAYASERDGNIAGHADSLVAEKLLHDETAGGRPDSIKRGELGSIVSFDFIGLTGALQVWCDFRTYAATIFGGICSGSVTKSHLRIRNLEISDKTKPSPTFSAQFLSEFHIVVRTCPGGLSCPRQKSVRSCRTSLFSSTACLNLRKAWKLTFASIHTF